MALDPFVGEIQPWPMDFAPRGWALCQGQLMPLGQNTALYSLLGTYFGGDGRSNFRLPDLRERIPIGFGDDWPGGTGGAASVEAEGVPVATGDGPAAIQQGEYDNRPPFMVMNYIIALQGVFPSRW